MINLNFKVDTKEVIKTELKKIYKDKNINYIKYNDDLYLNRAWRQEEQGGQLQECLCFTLNDRINIYINENLEVVDGDVITGEWEELEQEEAKEILGDIYNIITNEDINNIKINM